MYNLYARGAILEDIGNSLNGLTKSNTLTDWGRAATHLSVRKLTIIN